MSELERIFKSYKNKADFKVVYVREAHPADGWRMRENDREGIVVNDPKTLDERLKVANSCASDLKISIPIIVDDMNDTVEKLYAGWPDRIYVIDKHGVIIYKGAPGPRGFKPKEAENALKMLLEGK